MDTINLVSVTDKIQGKADHGINYRITFVK